MPLTDLPELFRTDPDLRGLLGRRELTVAVPEPARALTLAAVAAISRHPTVLVVTATAAEADRLAHDMAAFRPPDAVTTFPAWETLPYERVSPAVETMGRRLEAVWRLRGAERRPELVVAPVRALLQRLSPTVLDAHALVVRPGDALDAIATVTSLVESGYRREHQVEHRGELAVRGSIIDVFPSTADAPVRIDLWGDEVDRLTTFSVGDQRSVADLDEVVVLPAREVLPTETMRKRAQALVAEQPWGRAHWDRLADGELFDGMESWLPWLDGAEALLPDLLGPDDLVVVVDPRRTRDRAADLVAEEVDLARSLAVTWETHEDDLHRLHLPFERLLTGTDAPSWTVTGTASGPGQPGVEVVGWQPLTGDSGRLVGQVRRLLDEGYRIVVAADGEGSADRIVASLGREGLAVARAGADDDLTLPGARVVVAPLERGAVLPGLRLGLLTEAELTGRRRTHRRARPRRRDAQRFFEDLEPGDHVVHHIHGVARYEGMTTRAIMGAEKDYLLLSFRGGDRIYLPSDQIDLVRPYSGGETPSLSKMGGAEWAKTKARVRSAVQEVAQELVVLYQKRASTEGHAFGPDTPWQHELESSFPYQETPDQAAAIAAAKADMEQAVPMDRLVCGDVGFGKTEVAIRAVFKAVQDGLQAAVLVPTTLLAQQHFQTFGERYAGYPVRVEVLSRFLTTAQQRKVLRDLAHGDVDVVIGTHRLLGRDVEFKRLGLLVVDEEQRFGVKHKERIKEWRADVDVLTLTATPIPRTLEMSLTGIRDLTLLQTPPAERQPILTYVGDYDERAVAEAVRRELLREGQVFFVHNRVADIERVADELRSLVPEARVAVAHGQMDEGSLEQIVLDFWEAQYDVLVCTTIIESGIDMPTVNTLVVDRADLLGLGQLHQLRGRVGRAGQRAYAYLFHPADVSLSEEAHERLRTIGESTELGSGFRIAMRDLEIRGAGNLLGETQSGHIAAVGYDLYCQMVTEAVAELKGEPVRPPAEIKLDVPLDAHLPDTYVPREEQRLEAYRRLAAVTERADVADIRAEWEDRYGPLPPPAEALLRIAALRAACHGAGIREVTVNRGTARLSPVELPASKQVRLQRLHKGAKLKEEPPELALPLRPGDDPAEQLVAVIDDLYS